MARSIIIAKEASAPGWDMAIFSSLIVLRSKAIFSVTILFAFSHVIAQVKKDKLHQLKQKILA